jgi:hypothetical protein
VVEQKSLVLGQSRYWGLGDFYFLSGRKPKKALPNLTFGEKFSL